MNILFTGFEPWDDVVYNPSWDVAKAAARICNTTPHELAVTFELARNIGSLIFDENTCVVLIGVATSRTETTVERFAHVPNLFSANEGRSRRETGLDLTRLCAAINASESLNAGEFVCNATYYHALDVTRRCVFIHVPPMFPPEATKLGLQIGNFFKTLVREEVPCIGVYPRSGTT